MLQCTETLLCSAGGGCLSQQQQEQDQQQQSQTANNVQHSQISSQSSQQQHIAQQPTLQMQMIDIENPSDNDVLCGRGVALNNWRGNVQFRALVARHKATYVASTKRQKMTISRSIVAQVRAMAGTPGRFLEKDIDTGLWSDVGDKKAIEKTSQALRDGAALLRKQLMSSTSPPSTSPPPTSPPPTSPPPTSPPPISPPPASPAMTSTATTKQIIDHEYLEDEIDGGCGVGSVKTAIVRMHASVREKLQGWENAKDIIGLVSSSREALSHHQRENAKKPAQRSLSEFQSDNKDHDNKSGSDNKKTTTIVENTAVVASDDAVEGILMNSTPPRFLSSPTSSFSKPISPASTGDIIYVTTTGNVGTMYEGDSTHHPNKRHNSSDHNYYRHHPIISPSNYMSSSPTNLTSAPPTKHVGSSFHDTTNSKDQGASTTELTCPDDRRPLPTPPPASSVQRDRTFFYEDHRYRYHQEGEIYSPSSSRYVDSYEKPYQNYEEQFKMMGHSSERMNSSIRKRNYSDRRSVSFIEGCVSSTSSRNPMIRSESYDEVHINRHRSTVVPPPPRHGEYLHPEHHHYRDDRRPPLYNGGGRDSGGNTIHYDPYYYSTYKQRHHPLLSPSRGMSECETGSSLPGPYPQVHHPPPALSCMSFPPPPPAVVRSNKEVGEGFHPEGAIRAGFHHHESSYPRQPFPPSQPYHHHHWPHHSSYRTALDGQLFLPTLQHRHPYYHHDQHEPNQHHDNSKAYQQPATSLQDFTPPPITPDLSTETAKTPPRQHKILVPRAVETEEVLDTNSNSASTTSIGGKKGKSATATPEKKKKRLPPSSQKIKTENVKSSNTVDSTTKKTSVVDIPESVKSQTKMLTLSSDNPTTTGSTVASSSCGSESVCSSNSNHNSNGDGMDRFDPSTCSDNRIKNSLPVPDEDRSMTMILDRKDSREEKKDDEGMAHNNTADLLLPLWNTTSSSVEDHPLYPHNDCIDIDIEDADNNHHPYIIHSDDDQANKYSPHRHVGESNEDNDDDDDCYSCSPLPFFSDEVNDRLMDISDDIIMMSDLPLLSTSTTTKADAAARNDVTNNNNDNHNNNHTSDDEMSYDQV